MKKRIQNVFIELMKNAKKSDRDIAKKFNISQPTVTRIRKKLEKNVISAYTAVPILTEIGINLMSFNFGICDSTKKQIDLCLKQLEKTNPRVAFAASGEGMGKNCLVVAFHKDYRDYVSFLSDLRAKCKGAKSHVDSFVTPTSKDHVLNFGVPIADLLKEK